MRHGNAACAAQLLSPCPGACTPPQEKPCDEVSPPRPESSTTGRKRSKAACSNEDAAQPQIKQVFSCRVVANTTNRTVLPRGRERYPAE
ncbi:unnamed protein product [Rangifer tarandus platyrhynchus]|uniref:Uncharacterized protein n=1 Tax=Rangifer tarandus platyrhynchus TaxID=3082113 RepID=A0AC59ZWE8_RANTA